MSATDRANLARLFGPAPPEEVAGVAAPGDEEDSPPPPLSEDLVAQLLANIERACLVRKEKTMKTTKPTPAQLAALNEARRSIVCTGGRPYLPSKFEARSFEAMERKGLVRVEVLRTAMSQFAGYVLSDAGERALSEWLCSLPPVSV